MRSLGIPRQLECHAFICQTPEDAIVIAATLYQSLMSHMSTSQNKKSRKPRNQNGVSCISITSSSIGGNNQFGSVALRQLDQPTTVRPKLTSNLPSRPPRKKRSASSSLSGSCSDIVRDSFIQSSTEERKKKSHKSKRAPPIPGGSENSSEGQINIYLLF